MYANNYLQLFIFRINSIKMNKNFKLKAEEIADLIPPIGACFATDKITVDGMEVGYMYREKPDREMDSGWRFFSGTEDQEYIDDLSNTTIYSVNTIANYDPAIIPHLDMPYGTHLERIEGTKKFQIVNDD